MLNAVTCQVVPVADAYCTDQPFKLTATLPRLKSSMKSFLNVAPEFPPPPYTWLITTFRETAPRGKMDFTIANATAVAITKNVSSLRIGAQILAERL